MEGSTSSNQLQPCGVVDGLKKVEITIPTFMDPDLYSAAAEANIDKFRKDAGPLDGLLTPDENTILHIYLKNNQDEKSVSTEFVRQILQICPSLLHLANSEGEIPLHFAVINRQTNVVKCLIECAKAGSFVDPETNNIGTEAAKKMLRAGNKDDNTALHLAVLYKCLPIVQVLIKEDPHFQYSANNLGETPLSIAARKRQKEVMLEILKSCTWVDYRGPNGSTALHVAVRTHRPSPVFDLSDPIKKMMERNESLSKKADENGWMPLHYAAYFGDSTSVGLLLEKDKSLAYIGIKETRMTALHLATFGRYTSTMKVILEKCPYCCELVDNRGRNFLHYLAIHSPGYLFIAITFPAYLLTAIHFPYYFLQGRPKLFRDHPSLRYLLSKKCNRDITPLQTLCAFYYGKRPLYYSYLQRDIHFEEGLSLSSKKREEIFEMLRGNFDYGCGPEGEIVKRSAFSHGIIGGIEEAYKGVKESHLVVATLIATVTFAAGFTLPGGTEKGIALLRDSRAFQFFIVADAIALTLSTFSIFIQFIVALGSVPEITLFVLLFLEGNLTMLAMAAMVVAFVTGVYAVLAPTLAVAILTSCIGLSFFVFASFLIYEYLI